MSAHVLNHLLVKFSVLAVKKIVTNDDMFLKVLWKGSWTNKKVVRNLGNGKRGCGWDLAFCRTHILRGQI